MFQKHCSAVLLIVHSEENKANGATMRNSAAVPGGSLGNVGKVLVSALVLSFKDVRKHCLYFFWRFWS